MPLLPEQETTESNKILGMSPRSLGMGLVRGLSAFSNLRAPDWYNLQGAITQGETRGAERAKEERTEEKRNQMRSAFKDLIRIPWKGMDQQKMSQVLYELNKRYDLIEPQELEQMVQTLVKGRDYFENKEFLNLEREQTKKGWARGEVVEGRADAERERNLKARGIVSDAYKAKTPDEIDRAIETIGVFADTDAGQKALTHLQKKIGRLDAKEKAALEEKVKSAQIKLYTAQEKAHESLAGQRDRGRPPTEKQTEAEIDSRMMDLSIDPRIVPYLNYTQDMGALGAIWKDIPYDKVEEIKAAAAEHGLDLVIKATPGQVKKRLGVNILAKDVPAEVKVIGVRLKGDVAAQPSGRETPVKGETAPSAAPNWRDVTQRAREQAGQQATQPAVQPQPGAQTPEPSLKLKVTGPNQETNATDADIAQTVALESGMTAGKTKVGGAYLIKTDKGTWRLASRAEQVEIQQKLGEKTMAQKLRENVRIIPGTAPPPGGGLLNYRRGK